MFATFVLIAAVAGQACADCVVVKDRVRLCTPHSEEERLVFLRLRKQIVAEAAEDRCAALAEIARLTMAHQNAPLESAPEELQGVRSPCW